MKDYEKLINQSYNNPVLEKEQEISLCNLQAKDTTPENSNNDNEEKNNIPSTQNAEETSLNHNNLNEDNSNTQLPDIGGYINAARNALNSVDDIVMKGYLERLNQMDVVIKEESDIKDKVILFKVSLMAYEKDEYATDKFVSAFSAMTYTANSIFLIVDGFKDHTDFYIGIKNNSSYTTHSVANTLESSLKGQFPGIILEDLSITDTGKEYSKQHYLLRDIADATSISSSIGVPALKGKSSYTNNNYIQGIEKFSDAMQGKRYTAIILAQNQMPSSIGVMRSAYENLYSQLSCMASQQLAYSTNESLAHALTRSQGTSSTISLSVSNGTTHNESKNVSDSTGTSKSTNWSKGNGESEPNFWAKAAPLAGPILEAGAILTMTGVGAPIGGTIMAVGGALALGGMFGSKSKSKSQSEGGSESENINHTEGHSIADGISHNETDSNSHSDTITDSEGNTSTIGSSKNFTLTLHNKKVEELLKRIDKQLERIDAAEGTGLWSTSAYFLSYEEDKATSQTGAAIFRSIIQGDNSGVETSAINSWTLNESNENGSKVLKAITSFNHPIYKYSNVQQRDFHVEGTSLITSKELSMMMGLPRKSVPGLPVIDHLPFGKEVVTLNGVNNQGTIDIGVIFDQGVAHDANKVKLNAKSLTQHVFVTGSTGSGKSETVYRLLEEATKANATYLIIEPAKGEYKHVFGNANVFGTNPQLTKLIRINPFRFPDGIHVLEHIDRLVEIFNVCWPMYAAMPAVLKKAVIKSYENCGWKLYESTNKYEVPLFPSFIDLLQELETAINESAYSEEVKGNYIGSLVTRVESLTNGINGEIFSADEVSDEVLFDQNTIVDLSRIGAQETKSLIMGILIMRLNEYRVVNAKGANSGLRHLTVLEEAHNILKRTSTEQSMEGSNVTGKSVEMLINSIAEMRTYGEGFVIVDQSPTSVHAAAIKNTNTKIIMRLPDGDDRQISGKSAALKDNQIDEIAKLPTGVAIVYQNDWMQAVMAKISMMRSERIASPSTPDTKKKDTLELPMTEILKLFLKGRLATSVEPDIDAIITGITSASMPMATKGFILDNIKEYKSTGKLEIWKNDNFPFLSKTISDLLGVNRKVTDIAAKATSFDELNKLLSNLLKNKVGVPDFMDLSMRQVLMRNYAEAGTSQLKIYNAWLQDIKNNVR